MKSIKVTYYETLEHHDLISLVSKIDLYNSPSYKNTNTFKALPNQDIKVINGTAYRVHVIGGNS